MTYLDKVKELHPEFGESALEGVVIVCCPSDYGLEDSKYRSFPVCDMPDIGCRECWNREYVDPKKE